MAVKNLAVIAGNGLSIAYTKELRLDKITERLVAEFNNLSGDGSNVLTTFKNLASRIEADGKIDEKDFEQLVGSFESQTALLQDLVALAEILSEEDPGLVRAIEEVKEFTWRILSRGTGIVLKTILEASNARSESEENIQKLFLAINKHFGGKVTFANLNYDALVLSSLVDLKDRKLLTMCDLGAAYEATTLTLTSGSTNEEEAGKAYKAFPLRTKLNFPENSKFRLVHPHGSLTYWQHKDEIPIDVLQEDALPSTYKIPIDVLRDNDLLSTLGRTSKNYLPAVVLANSREKPKRVERYPFNLAYRAMSKALDSSNHWLIVGYSFRDESVNEKMRSALSKKTMQPKILISTWRDELTEDEVRNALGLEEPLSRNISIDRDGAVNLELRSMWKEFIN